MSSPVTHKLPVLESNRLESLKDMASAVLHSLIFNRSLGLPEPKEAKCQTLSTYYVSPFFSVSIDEMWRADLWVSDRLQSGLIARFSIEAGESQWWAGCQLLSHAHYCRHWHSVELLCWGSKEGNVGTMDHQCQTTHLEALRKSRQWRWAASANCNDGYASTDRLFHGHRPSHVRGDEMLPIRDRCQECSKTLRALPRGVLLRRDTQEVDSEHLI